MLDVNRLVMTIAAAAVIDLIAVAMAVNGQIDGVIILGPVSGAVQHDGVSGLAADDQGVDRAIPGMASRALVPVLAME